MANNTPNRDPATPGTGPAAAGAAATSADALRAAAAPEMQSISDDVADLKRELGRLSTMVSEMAQARYRDAREQAAGVAQDYVDRGMALKDEAYERATAMEREVERTIKDRPIAAVAIAAGVGYLIGLVSRSHH